mmetsp:Transcript_12848/g.51692  ORF Transcript_12848/g.51692 Transcript_12848/m.51692 type:complete len:199 (-) Transcript_12848:163-759(-)
MASHVSDANASSSCNRADASKNDSLRAPIAATSDVSILSRYEPRRAWAANPNSARDRRGGCDEDDDTAGAVVVVFDSLNALADGEPTAADADRAVPSLLASVSSLRRGSTAIVALAHRDACPTDGRGWLDAARRRADVVVSCRALTTGHAADVHGRVSAEHRTGRMATTATNGSAAPRRVDARFRLTELGPKVTRVHA